MGVTTVASMSSEAKKASLMAGDAKALDIVIAMGVNADGILTEDDLVHFYTMLSACELSDAAAQPNRPPEQEAQSVIQEFGADGKISVKAYQEFLAGIKVAKAENVIQALQICRNKLFGKMLDRVKNFDGFLAALDQSGGSTPKALAAYGVQASEYNGDAEMFDKMHEMRTRIVSCPAFNGDDVLGAILFEMTMNREILGMPSAKFLWEKLHVVPFVKCDKGLADEQNDCQLMKPMPDLDDLMIRARGKGVFGTKERSLIKKANREGIKAIVEQQFAVAKQIIGHGLCPILEPEVDITSETKEEAEAMLKEHLLEGLNQLTDNELVMLKLSIPTVDNLYKELIDHPKVVKVVALSGGYSRDQANAKLANQNGMVASFSRALTEGLSAQLSDEEFNNVLSESIKSIHAASST